MLDDALLMRHALRYVCVPLFRLSSFQVQQVLELVVVVASVELVALLQLVQQRRELAVGHQLEEEGIGREQHEAAQEGPVVALALAGDHCHEPFPARDFLDEILQ